MDKDRISGAASKAEGAMGSATGDARIKAEGEADKAKCRRA